MTGAGGSVSMPEKVLVFGAHSRVAYLKGNCSVISVSLRVQLTLLAPRR